MQRSNVICCVFASVLILAVFGASVGHAAPTTTISIVPPPIPVLEGEDFTVFVDIYNVVDMVSYQLEISWDPNYLDYASHTVSPPWLGFPVLIPDPIIDRTNGHILLGALVMDATAKFSGSATLATITFHTLKSGVTNIDFAQLPQISPPPVIIQTSDATVTILPTFTWVSVAGGVTSYGPEPAMGWINMFAVEENPAQNWTEGWSLFTAPPFGPRILIFPPPPADFTIYFVRVVNSSSVRLNYNGADLWISGFFRVANVTNPRALIDIAGLLKGGTVAAGTFAVTGGWVGFNLTVQGYDSILGDVNMHIVKHLVEFPGRLPYSDINGDGKVDIKDLAVMAMVYGSYLGDDRYEFYPDINADLKVDIKDLALAAKYYGRQY